MLNRIEIGALQRRRTRKAPKQFIDAIAGHSQAPPPHHAPIVAGREPSLQLWLALAEQEFRDAVKDVAESKARALVSPAERS